MFDFVQEKKRLVQFVLALIILPFAFWGVDSYQKSGDGESLASVNGTKIHPQEFDNALRQQQQRMQEMAGSAFDRSMVESPEFKNTVLQGLVSQRLLEFEAAKVGLSVTDEELAGIISGIEAFSTDGKFDKRQYEKMLSAQNMSAPMFESKVRQELSSRQLTNAYTQNGYASSQVADNLIRLNEQQRVVGLAKLEVNAFLSQVKVTDAAISDYYQKNQSEFKTTERARVEYVLLSADAMQSQVQVKSDEVKQYYDEHQSEFATQEQRQAAHILISVATQASDSDEQAAKSKAEEVLKKVKQTPANFAALAKQFSQDPGSAANGGDLGMFGRGMMVKPFEEAVFNLKVGEISGLVQSDFGFHIIRLSAIKSPKVQAYAEVAGLIEQRLKAQKSSDLFAELAEKFSNAAYEQSDSLKPAAELIKASVQQGVWLSKGQAAAGLWTDKVLQAVFSEDAIKNKRNTAAVEVAPNTLLAARIVEYQPANVRPLAEVSSAIQAKLQRQQALELVAKQGKELLTRLQNGERVNVAWQPVQSISRAQRAVVDIELAKLIFQANTAKLPAYVGVQTAQNGFALARIDAVKETTAIDADKLNRYMQQIRQITGEELLQAFLADAKENASISVKAFVGEDKR
ncbi:MAG: SurA N-terminal domain-containing protein [Gallionellaceae bacterium]|jgi:peptidyl-prolyl cis-trans isomerase D